MSATDYNNLLDIMAPLLAVLFWAAFWMLRAEGKKHFQRVPLMRLWRVWVAHVAVFWTCNSVYRWFFVYEGPAVLFSLWSMILYLHAGLSLVWHWWMLRRYPTPPLILPEDWEGRNDD